MRIEREGARERGERRERESERERGREREGERERERECCASRKYTYILDVFT